MDKFDHLCKKHNVIVSTAPEFIYKYRKHLSIKDVINLAPCATSIKTTAGQCHIITTDTDDEITKWHELGHILHPLGGMQKYNPTKYKYHTLTAELAASYWALTNVDDLVSYTTAKEKLLCAVKTYTENNFNKCEDNDKYRIMARKIGIEHEITWVTTNNKLTDWSKLTHKDIFGW